MAENPTIFQLAQVGLEVTPGTAVAATKRLTGLAVEMSIQAETQSYRAAGYKWPTVAALGKEWAEARLSGPLTYTESLYILNSLIKFVTPSGAGSDKTWTIAPTSTASDTRKTYTLEHGSADRGRRFAYGLVTGASFAFGRDAVTVDATMIGKAITDNHTMTALTSANEIALVPVLPTQGLVYLADSAAGLAGATALGRAFSATLNVQNLSAPVWPINQSSAFAAMVDTVPSGDGSVLLAIDAEGMAPLTNMRSGDTKFMRIKYTGAVLGGSTYAFTVDVAMKVKAPRALRDEGGVYAVEWAFDVAHDSTWGKGLEFVVVSSLAAL